MPHAPPPGARAPHAGAPPPRVLLLPQHAGDGEGGTKKKRLQRVHQGDKSSKGLRHFSMKVCNKVEEKMRTTYNEVADELVAEFVPADSLSPTDQARARSTAPAGRHVAHRLAWARAQAYDEKNIRRRVYDALNVLMAMDIIAKEKKNITWRGLPTNAKQEAHKLQEDAEQRRERIAKKRQQLQELLTQQISFKHLVRRNREHAAQAAEHNRVYLPFIIVNTCKKTVIDCEMAEDKHEIFFKFSMPFEYARGPGRAAPPSRPAPLMPGPLVGLCAQDQRRQYHPQEHGHAQVQSRRPPAPRASRPHPLHTPVSV